MTDESARHRSSARIARTRKQVQPYETELWTKYGVIGEVTSGSAGEPRLVNTHPGQNQAGLLTQRTSNSVS